MPLPREVIDWRDRAEIDHIGPFVKAWAAFNAWYRYVSGHHRDADAIRHICSLPNPVRSAILPFLDPATADTPDAIAFKQHIANLHGALEAHRLETRHKNRLEHVSFRAVPIGQPKTLPQQTVYRNVTYRLERVGQWKSIVRTGGGVEIFAFEQADYSLADLEAAPGFAALSAERAGQLRSLYKECDPRPMLDLLNAGGPAVPIGTATFRASCEQLFAGTIQTIYRMRNMLLHGELAPDPAALAGFEHAFHLLRRMLRECH